MTDWGKLEGDFGMNVEPETPVESRFIKFELEVALDGSATAEVAFPWSSRFHMQGINEGTLANFDFYALPPEATSRGENVPWFLVYHVGGNAMNVIRYLTYFDADGIVTFETVDLGDPEDSKDDVRWRVHADRTGRFATLYRNEVHFQTERW